MTIGNNSREYQLILRWWSFPPNPHPPPLKLDAVIWCSWERDRLRFNFCDSVKSQLLSNCTEAQRCPRRIGPQSHDKGGSRDAAVSEENPNPGIPKAVPMQNPCFPNPSFSVTQLPLPAANTAPHSSLSCRGGPRVDKEYVQHWPARRPSF